MSEEEWQTHVEFATISVRNFGGASGDMTLKPLTLLYGPPESAVSHVASLINAVVVHGGSYFVHDDVLEVPCYETHVLEPYLHVDLEEARRVMERRRQKVRFTDSEYLAAMAKRHLHLLATGLEAGLLGPDSPLRPDAAGFSVTLAANRAHGRLEYSDGGFAEFPDRPNLRINFVTHGTARKGDWKYVDESGPYLAHDPYYGAGPRPYESNGGIEIHAYRGGGVKILRNVLNAALHYYCERTSQPRWSVLASDGGLTGYEPPKHVRSGDVLYGTRLISSVFRFPVNDSIPPKRLQSALDEARRGTMVVMENPEKYAGDTESFARTLFAKANEGLFVLVATGDRTLAEAVVEMRREPGGLDAEYASVYGFEPEGGGHAITEY